MNSTVSLLVGVGIGFALLAIIKNYNSRAPRRIAKRNNEQTFQKEQLLNY